MLKQTDSEFPVGLGKLAGSLAKKALGTHHAKRPDFSKPHRPGYPPVGKIVGTAMAAARKVGHK